MVTSPLAWTPTCQSWLCASSIGFVELILRHRQDAVVLGADVRRAHAHRPLGGGAVGDELHAADADPLVAEAGVDVGGLQAGVRLRRADHHVGAVRQLAVAAGSPRRRGSAPALVIGVVHRREAGGVEQLRHVRHALARAIARCSGVKVSRLPTRLNTLRAFSATRPFSSPFSLKKRPSAGSGVCVGDAGQLERLAVVEVGVAAAVRDRHRVLGRRLVEILARQRTIELGVVEHEAR